MSHLKSLMDKIESDPIKKEELGSMFDNLMSNLQRQNRNIYDSAMHELEDIAYSIPKEEAERIVKAMTPKGQKWSYNTIEEYVREKGITSHFCHWYLVMNMMYNDYYSTARKYGHQDDEEFYHSLAHDFIDDPDAKPHKVERYFLD